MAVKLTPFLYAADIRHFDSALPPSMAVMYVLQLHRSSATNM